MGNEEKGNNIPKVIHYFWFGGKPLTKLAKKCIKSWERYFPDYEIKQWNESNFDVNCCKYVQQAYEQKKWAFVSDYARFKVLYENGGVYFDTDVQVIRSFDDILEKGAYMGCENPRIKYDEKGNVLQGCKVAVGLGCAVCKNNEVYKEILDDYEKSEFVKQDGMLNLYTVVDRTTDCLKKYGLVDSMEIQTVKGITVYPSEYFCPINMDSGKLEKTKNTYSIHRYACSWVSKKEVFRGKVYNFIYRVFGEKFAEKVRKVVGKK